MDTNHQVRPDIDIEEEIRGFIRSYDPLKQARGHFQFSCVNGNVKVWGHVRTVQAKRVLIDNIYPDIEGVVSLDASGLYDDESLRLEVGRLLPPGVLVRFNYGSVVLTFPESIQNADEVLDKVKRIPGIRAESVAAEKMIIEKPNYGKK